MISYRDYTTSYRDYTTSYRDYTTSYRDYTIIYRDLLMDYFDGQLLNNFLFSIQVQFDFIRHKFAIEFTFATCAAGHLEWFR